jgi:hypothetical protein
MATTKIEFQVRGIDISVDYENRIIEIDEELPQDVVRVVGKYLVDEGFIVPEEDTEFYDE